VARQVQEQLVGELLVVTDEDATESDEPREDPAAAIPDHPGKQKWYNSIVWPFEASPADHELLQNWASLCKLWTGCNYRLPGDVFADLGALKIHGSYCMTGAIGSYVIHQCKGMFPPIKAKVVGYLFGLEQTTFKCVNKPNLFDTQGALINSIASLTPVLPLHVTSNGVVEQIQHWDKQVVLCLL
jgi:hypothetical protein